MTILSIDRRNTYTDFTVGNSQADNETNQERERERKRCSRWNDFWRSERVSHSLDDEDGEVGRVGTIITRIFTHKTNRTDN